MNRCEYVSCHKQPNYGYEGQRACFCSTHKLPNMVDVKHRYDVIIYLDVDVCVYVCIHHNNRLGPNITKSESKKIRLPIRSVVC